LLDDWGPDRLTANQRRDLMEIIEDRYGRGSTLITSSIFHPYANHADSLDGQTARAAASSQTQSALCQ
jgi:DNA replication protein DnaC